MFKCWKYRRSRSSRTHWSNPSGEFPLLPDALFLIEKKFRFASSKCPSPSLSRMALCWTKYADSTAVSPQLTPDRAGAAPAGTRAAVLLRAAPAPHHPRKNHLVEEPRDATLPRALCNHQRSPLRALQLNRPRGELCNSCLRNRPATQSPAGRASKMAIHLAPTVNLNQRQIFVNCFALRDPLGAYRPGLPAIQRGGGIDLETEAPDG